MEDLIIQMSKLFKIVMKEIRCITKVFEHPLKQSSFFKLNVNFCENLEGLIY